MHKRIFILALPIILVFAKSASSQSTINEVDKETYQLYLQQDWKKLIEKGKGAKKEGINFYYLNYRIGIAYYSLKNYRASIPYFKDAYEVDNTDNKLIEYLYFAYLFSGLEKDAKLLASKATKDQKQNLTGCKPNFFNKINLHYNSSKISDKSLLSQSNIESKIASSDNGIQQISKEYSIVNFGISHQFTSCISLYHAYTGLNKRNYYYTKDFYGALIDEDRLSTQNQYYANIDILPINRFNINGGIHYLGISYLTEKVDTNRFGRQLRRSVSENSDEIVYHAGIGYSVRNFDFGVAASKSNLNGNKQFQKDLSITYYPKGNLNLYSVTRISHQRDKGEIESKDNWVLYQKIGIGIKSKVWIEPFIMHGEIKNFSSSNSSIIYNSADAMKELKGCNFIAPIFKRKLLINIMYAHSKYESAFNEFNKGELDNTTIYNHNAISGGILWNF